MPVSFSTEKPVKLGIPEGFEPNQIDKAPSKVKFSTEKPVTAPQGGVGETVVNVTKAAGRGFESMLQGFGRALQWAAETDTTPEGATSFKKTAGEIATKLIPIPVAGRAAGEYVGEIADKLRPEWHKNLDIWARNAIKKVGSNVVNYYQKGIEGDILAPTPAFRQAQKMGWTTLPLEKALVATAESAPSFVSAVAAGLILKNPHVPLALLGGLQATQTYGSLRDQNIDQEVASTAAVMSGALEAVTEKIPFDELLKGTAGPALKRFVKVGTMESFQELLAQMGGNYINFAAKEYKPGDLKSVLPALKIQWGELANGWFEAMSAGFLMGGGAATAVKPAAGPTVEAATAPQVTPQPAPQVVPLAPAAEETVTETTPGNVTKPLQINITAEESTPIQATDISDLADIKQQVAQAPMTGKQRLLLKNMIGDIETKVVKEIVDKYPEPITDQASLETVGNKIAKDLGITDEIEWEWDTKGVTRNMGTHWKTGDKKHKIRIRGNHPKHKNKAILTDTVVHEIGHIASPPVTKKADLGNLRVEPDPGGGYRVYDAKGISYRVVWAQNPDEAINGVLNAKTKRSVHHSAFKKWLAENLKAVLPSEVSKRIPLINDLIVAQPGYESIETFTSPSESPLIHGQYAILTAENPNAQPATPEANKAANAAMLEQLQQDGYEPIPVEGHYGGNPENSFIVPNMSDEDALRYGKQFGQQSVLTPKGLVYQDGSINPSDKTNIDFSGKQEDFYTVIRIGGKPIKFSIPIDFDTKIPAMSEMKQAPDRSDVTDKKTRIKQLKEQLKTFLAEHPSGELTAEQADVFTSLSKELNSLRFDVAKPITPDMVKPADARKSVLPVDVVVAAQNELLQNKDVWSAINDAAMGVKLNADTAVDDIMNGQNPKVTPQKLYDAFSNTRDLLRSIYGDTITLFRSEGRQKQKATKNWASTREGAEQYGGNIVSKSVKVDDIVALNVSLNGGYEEFIVRTNISIPSEKSEKRTGAKPRPVKPANPATNDQKMRINILAKNLGLTSEQRHALQEQLTGKKSLRAMTVDEAKLVDQHLTKLATEKGLITATAQELTARLQEANIIPDEKPEVKGKREKGLRKLLTTINETAHNFIDRLWHIDRLIEQLDGMEKGPLYNTIWRKVRDAGNNAADAKHDRIQKFKNAGESIFGGPDGFSQFLTAKEQDLGGGVKVSPAERVGVYVYSKNKDSLRHLLGGNFASFPDPQIALVRVLETTIPQERAFGEWVLQDMAENFDRMNQASILSLGRELTEQDNYFSMYLSEVELEQQDDFLSALLDLQRQPGTVSEPGETISRKRGAKQPIRLDAVANYLHHVDRMEQFVHMGPIARQVGGILNNREFKRTLNTITYNTGSDILTKWLKDSTLGYTAEGTSWLARQILFFRQAGVQFAMGWKIPSVFRQFLSLPTAAAVHPSVGARVGVHLTGSAKPSYYRRLQDTAFSKSAMMRHRSMERVSDYINTRMTPAQRMQYKRNWSSEAMAWMQWADRHTAVIAWNGLYDSALHSPAVQKQFGLDGSEKAAIEFADDWVGRTQSMGNVTYLSDFFRGGVVEKLLTTFQNEDNTKWNFWAHDIIQAKRSGQIDKKMVAYRLLLSYIIPSLLYGIIGRGRLQKNWKEVAFDESTYVLGPLFLAGRMVYNAIQGFAGGASGPEEIGWVELEKTIENAIEGKGGKAALHGIKAAGALTGRIPSQAITTGTGAYDLATGETKDLRRLIYTDWSLTKYGTQFNDKEDGQPQFNRRAR